MSELSKRSTVYFEPSIYQALRMKVGYVKKVGLDEL